MTEDTRPRRFFGLLCAHKWKLIGTRTREYIGGRMQEKPILQCLYCGDLKEG